MHDLVKKWLKYTIIIGLNVFILSLIYTWFKHNVNISELQHNITQVNALSLVVAGILGVITLTLYGYRMSVLLNTPYKDSVKIVTLGFGFNLLLPFRLGDVLKIFFSKHYFGIDLTKVTLASILEKLFDIGILCGIGYFVLSHNYTYLIIIPIVLLAGCWFARSYLINSLTKINLLKKLIDVLFELLAKHKLFKLITATFTIWILTILSFLVFFKLNPGFSHFGITDAMSMVVFTTLSLSIPSMPASIGLFESGIVYYLTHHMHFSPEQAIAYAILFHLSIMIPQLVLTFVIVIQSLFTQKEPLHAHA